MNDSAKIRNIILQALFALFIVLELALQSCSVNDNSMVNGNGPATPTNLVLSLLSSYEIRLFWKEPTGQTVTGFQVQRAVTGDSVWHNYAIVPAHSSNLQYTFTDSGLVANTYYYRIYAFNSQGNSNPTPQLFINTALVIFPPKNITVAATSETSVKLTWQLTTNTQTGFLVARRSGLDTTYFNIAGKSTSFTDTTVHCGSVYLYYIQGYIVDSVHTTDTLERSGFSTPVVATTSFGDPVVLQTGIIRSMNAVARIDSLTAVSVGLAGVIYKTTDGGMTWDSLKSKVHISLNGVAFSDALHGIIVADNGKIFRTIDGGQTWNPATSSTSLALRSVCFISPDVVFACGNGGGVVSSADSGRTWRSHVTGIVSMLTSICFPNPDTGYAVGAAGAIVGTTDGGASWRIQQSRISLTLEGVSFWNGLSGLAVGASGIILGTTDGGATWLVQKSPTGITLTGISYFGFGKAIAVGLQGVMVYTGTGGYSWMRQDVQSSSNFTAISLSSKNQGYIVGSAGAAMRLDPCY